LYESLAYQIAPLTLSNSCVAANCFKSMQIMLHPVGFRRPFNYIDWLVNIAESQSVSHLQTA